MTNRIRHIDVYDRRLTPAEAHVMISVEPERLTSGTEVRGRLAGPRCAYATTVEVAYPVRPVPRPSAGERPPRIFSSVIIPEPNWWEPPTPFLYQGAVELWENGQVSEQAQVSHGLVSRKLEAHGLRLNGRPFTVRGLHASRFSEDDALRWHRAGFNTVLAPLGADMPVWWSTADRFGFLVLGSIGGRARPRSEEPMRSAHPSALGWLLTEEAPPRELPGDPSAPTGTCLGCELHAPPAGPLPSETRLVVCKPSVLPSLAALPLPKILRVDRRPVNAEETEWRRSAGVIGWICDSPEPP